MNPTCSTDQPMSPETDFVELIWENGQISMQGQSNRGRKSSASRSVPSHSPRACDREVGNGVIARMGKFGEMESVFDEMELTQDEDVIPWFNYPIDESLQHDYSSDFLHELSGVTVNEIPSTSNVPIYGRRNSSEQVHMEAYLGSSEQGKASKVSLVGGVEASACKTSSSQLCQSSSQQFQMSFASFRQKVPGNNTKNNGIDRALHVDLTQVPSTSVGFSSLKMQKQDSAPPSKSPTMMNFSHFARPAALVSANLQNIGFVSGKGPARMENEKCAASSSNPHESTTLDSGAGLPKESKPSQVAIKPLDGKPSQERVAASDQAKPVCIDEQAKDDKNSNQMLGESATKGSVEGEKNVEPAVASSSVCSVTSKDRASDDPVHNLKRKFRDNEDSECHSEDVEEESVGLKKSAHGRGGTSSKRSRAAEVHNLSERRRRDRINEKMRALQELIPNCNKVDKASMLDEAIEYLKTLQLQVQIMSMGAGLYMPPMMLPTMQHLHAPHLAPFSPVGVGMQMGLGMGYGMGMPDMNSGSPGYPMIQVPQMQGPYFPVPPMPGNAALPGMAGSSVPAYGLPGQGLAVPTPGAPLIPPPRGSLTKSAVGMNACGTSCPSENADLASGSGSKDPIQNVSSQVMQRPIASNPLIQISSECQGTNAGFKQSALSENERHASEVDGGGVDDSGKDNLLHGYD